ncbi:MAG: bifunctional phosphoribosylaminoimidazolecarboxamide formyltransferase/IMP cyclohydrolase [Candidatus Omnitrophica bacterium]|nr:bifunctional phosphoribosylaminoimidazolecarboxamide formyltransferase/IMP cyclohydrolase [Candidatus Omnitrophota bacterium]
MVTIKRALISVSDKTGLDELVKTLHGFGVEIISTGGTAKRIQELGVPVRLVSQFTGSPEMLDGRVKTLHPKIHGGLLALRDDKHHREQIEKFNLELIDMVVVNLYPFEKTVAAGASLADAIENIDIGGPSMLRSAAKNFRSVAVLCDPQRYAGVIAEMQANNGAVTSQTRFELAAEVFGRTAEYDGSIAAYLHRQAAPASTPDEGLPEQITIKVDKVQALRYGENPHQQAAFYKDRESGVCGIAQARQLHGKELSFNNILDLDAAITVVRDFDDPAVCIIKHTNPCGAASAATLAEAYTDALDCDPLSAFGSIVGANRSVDADTARRIIGADFVECLVAPGFSAEALELLKRKKNLRIMALDGLDRSNPGCVREWDYKRVNGGLLVQERNGRIIDMTQLKVVTKKEPSPEQMRALLFAWTMVKHVRSNAIVLVQGTKTVGVGAGQMSRVDSVMIAIRKAGNRAAGAVLGSDAFFPKSDSITEATQAGITAIIQPGGSIRDQEVIDAADRAGIAMVVTGMRHFKH